MKSIDVNDTSDENISFVLEAHARYADMLRTMELTEKVTGSPNQYKADIIKEQQKAQKFLSNYFSSIKDGRKTAVVTANEILERRKFEINKRAEDGSEDKVELVDIGLGFIHEQFNGGNKFPISTFFSLFADSGVGKSDYFYRIANSLLLQDYKVMICSFEYGEQRMGNLIDAKENGGKDRLREARLSNKFDNLFVNYQARDIESLSLMIDIAKQNNVKAVLIDSFGEIERTESEYILQQKLAVMLNSKVNDYGMFIGIIGQTKTGEVDGDYTVRGGSDLIYKPDISIHVKKVSKEDVSGDRIVHLFKNREADINGRTIVTEYDFETREPRYKCDYKATLSDGSMARDLKFRK